MFEFVNKFFNERRIAKTYKTLAKHGIRPVESSQLPFFDMIFRLNNEEYISNNQAIEFYNNVGVVGDAVNRITDAMMQVKPVIFDLKEKKFLDYYSEELRDGRNYDANNIKNYLSLLKKPDPMHTCKYFMKRLASYFLITGTAYIVAYGYSESKIEELEVIANDCVSHDVNVSDDVFPNSYTITRAGETYKFYKTKDLKSKNIRYVSDDKLKELYIIKNFSTKNNNLEGISFFNSIKSDIRQYFESGKHNFAMLKNGARLSGVFVAENELGEKQAEDFKKQIRSIYKGSDNAGAIGFFYGQNLKYQPMASSMVDMDFKELKKMLLDAIYNALGIPLIMINVEVSGGLEQYQAGVYSFYNNNVLIKLDYVWDEFSRQIFPRFNLDYMRYSTSYVESSIRAIRDVEIDNIRKLSQIYFMRINELRDMVGRERLENGDVTMLPVNMMPDSTMIDKDYYGIIKPAKIQN